MIPSVLPAEETLQRVTDLWVFPALYFTYSLAAIVSETLIVSNSLECLSVLDYARVICVPHNADLVGKYP